MKDFDLFHHVEWYPLASLGYTGITSAINLDTLFFTWCAIGILVLFACTGRFFLKKSSLAGFLTQKYVDTFASTVEQSLPHYRYIQFSFITTLFSYIFICNTILFFPFFEEPTKDINTTLALGITSFIFVQYQIARTIGVGAYVQEYIKFPLSFSPHYVSRFPFSILEVFIRIILNSIVAIIAFPLEIMGKLASVISLSFRLFGNIFGGSVIMSLWKYFISGSVLLQTLGILTGINFILLLVFGFFEGFIQAFVFAILSLTYLSLGIQHE